MQLDPDPVPRPVAAVGDSLLPLLARLLKWRSENMHGNHTFAVLAVAAVLVGVAGLLFRHDLARLTAPCLRRRRTRDYDD